MENEYISDITYPTEEEIRAAQHLCCGRVCKECEVPAAYAWRKKAVDMALLLEKAIEDELTETERAVIKDIWYNSLSLSQTARKRGITPNAVKHTSVRAMKKLENALKYVVFYCMDITKESVVPAAVGRARVIASARNMISDDAGMRLKNLRTGCGMSQKMLSVSTGVTEKRIEEIETGDMPKTDELLIFSEFFAVTTDYILKGDNNV